MGTSYSFDVDTAQPSQLDALPAERRAALIVQYARTLERTSGAVGTVVEFTPALLDTLIANVPLQTEPLLKAPGAAAYESVDLATRCHMASEVVNYWFRTGRLVMNRTGRLVWEKPHTTHA
jgi:hypothetical protein